MNEIVVSLWPLCAPKNDDASVMLGISRSPNGIAAPTDVWKMSEPSRHIPSFPIFDDEVLLPVKKKKRYFALQLATPFVCCFSY